MRRRGVVRAAAVLAAVLAAGALLWPGPHPRAPAGSVPAGDRAPAPLDGAGPLRIVAFGTSLTARGTWPDRLAARLADCLGRPVRMVRVAGVGQGSSWALGQLDRVIAAGPDIVLIEFAINDADLLDGVRPARSRVQHDRILDALRADLPDARPVLMTMNPVAGLHRVKRLRLGAYYAMYRALAADRDIGLADLAPRWRADWPALRPPDGLHPQDAAHAAVTVPALAGILARAAGAPPADAPTC